MSAIAGLIGFMDAIALSQNGVLIRLPDERWKHIVQRYADLASRKLEVLATVSDPMQVFAANSGRETSWLDVGDHRSVVIVYANFELF